LPGTVCCIGKGDGRQKVRLVSKLPNAELWAQRAGNGMSRTNARLTRPRFSCAWVSAYAILVCRQQRCPPPPVPGSTFYLALEPHRLLPTPKPLSIDSYGLIDSGIRMATGTVIMRVIPQGSGNRESRIVALSRADLSARPHSDRAPCLMGRSTAPLMGHTDSPLIISPWPMAQSTGVRFPGPRSQPLAHHMRSACEHRPAVRIARDGKAV
jgi:hypothetical protein